MTNEEVEPIKPCEQSWQTMSRDDLVEERDSMRAVLEGFYGLFNLMSKRKVGTGPMQRQITEWSGLIALIDTYIHPEA